MERKPEWLNKKIDLKTCNTLRRLLRDLKLHTICEEAFCPNISECFSKGTATFLILGNICTRNCAFCGVRKGKPSGVDEEEPERVAEAVKRLNLRYAVITSVTRDDLDDGGAEQFVRTILKIREKSEKTKIEVLIPDFGGNEKSVEKIVEAKPDVIGHNIETVPRLYPVIRPKANYSVSLNILKMVKKMDSSIYTKSGLILGFGEKEEEVIDVLKSLREVNCDFLSLGQYLPPRINSYPVKEYIHPDKFDYYKNIALSSGFLHVESGPYVRSSYLAEQYLK
ncbi:MAG: lipoyl synthase [Candidatus Omnitrophota bacterium]|nr:MAG: lipoyl synthase [Candidatus Omnitrophota bacterium]HDN98035.1 lipoyl synthase [bacterium]